MYFHTKLKEIKDIACVFYCGDPVFTLNGTNELSCPVSQWREIVVENLEGERGWA